MYSGVRRSFPIAAPLRSLPSTFYFDPIAATDSYGNLHVSLNYRSDLSASRWEVCLTVQRVPYNNPDILEVSVPAWRNPSPRKNKVVRAPRFSGSLSGDSIPGRFKQSSRGGFRRVKGASRHVKKDFASGQKLFIHTLCSILPVPLHFSIGHTAACCCGATNGLTTGHNIIVHSHSGQGGSNGGG